MKKKSKQIKTDTPLLTEEDQQLFKQAMQRVNPLKGYPKKIYHKKDKIHIVPSLIKEISVKNKITYSMTQKVASSEYLFFARPGLQQRLLRKLKQGSFPIQDSIDLHGLYLSEANDALYIFLKHAQFTGYKYLHLIHGKGRSEPKLKNLINQVLQEYPSVLAFCSAQPKDGGTGAVYILLKNIDKTPFPIFPIQNTNISNFY